MTKVLVIEDNEAIRENTAELLLISNYHVFTAENGREGYERAQQQQPDVVLCDMMMPETDGRGFLQLLKDNEALRQVPIIFFSAGTLQEEEHKKLLNSASGYLKKPFLKEELLCAIQAVLAESSTCQAEG